MLTFPEIWLPKTLLFPEILSACSLLSVEFRSYYKSDVENIYSVLSVLKDVDVDLFPFGDDPSGNMICLKGEKVFFWNHETDALEFVADSISDFMAKLYW